jgi:hypothetical protein
MLGAVFWKTQGVVVGVLVFFGSFPIIGGAVLRTWSDWYW